MLMPATTARISSRKSVRKESGSGEALATLAMSPGNQELASNHSTVQFVHRCVPVSERFLQSFAEIEGATIRRGRPSCQSGDLRPAYSRIGGARICRLWVPR